MGVDTPKRCLLALSDQVSMLPLGLVVLEVDSEVVMAVEDSGVVIAATVDTVPVEVSVTKEAAMDLLADSPPQMRRLVLAAGEMLASVALTVAVAGTNATLEGRQAATVNRYGQGKDILNATDVTMIATVRVTAAGTGSGTTIATGIANEIGTVAEMTSGGRDTTKTIRTRTLAPSGDTERSTLDTPHFSIMVCWWVSLTSLSFVW